MNISETVERLLRDVEKPARYCGGERNAVQKDPEGVQARFCMAFPDTYEVGMSHLGSRIIYALANEREDTYCERAFAPWVDMEGELRAAGIPLARRTGGRSIPSSSAAAPAPSIQSPSPPLWTAFCWGTARRPYWRCWTP